MKIAVNTRFLLKNKLEGIGRVSYEVVKRMVAAHPEDEFIFFFDRPYDPDFIFGKNVRPVVLFPPARHPVLWYWWFEYSLAAALNKYQPDVFLSPDNYLSLRSDTKTVMITHDMAHLHYPDEIPFLVRKYYNYFVPKFLKRADRVISVSEFTKQDILKNYTVPESKITVAHNACSAEFQPVSESKKNAIREKYTQGHEYFFYLGSIHPRKNIPRLIRAFDLFKSNTGSEMKLLLAGRFAWQTGPVKIALDEISCKKDVIITGFIEQSELPGIISAARALTYVSLFEGFGLPILEAMHCDTPVITSNVSSMPEVAGRAALLVDPTSIQEIAAAMQKIRDPEIAQQLIAAGNFQREKFNWDKTANIIYEKLAALRIRSPQR